MKTETMFVILLGSLVSLSTTMVASGTVTITDLDALVGRWMDLRSATADETRQWQARREQWQVEIRLLEEEKAKLAREVDAFKTFASTLEKDRVTLLARKETMKQVLQALEPLIARTEKRLQAWRPWIPTALAPRLGKIFDALPQAADTGSQSPLSERIQRVVALYTQIETLQAGLHTTREILDTGNAARRQVDILYIGLARAFAVSPDNLWAAVGAPRAQGWEWTERSAVAPQVRLALQLLERQKTAALVDLPMAVTAPTKRSSEGGQSQ